MKFSKPITIIILCILFYAFNYCIFLAFNVKSEYIIWSDAQGYYQYLPSLFVKHDITHMGYATPLANGMTLNSFTYGTALLESPFFILAHLYSKICGFVADGYTGVYGFSIWIAASMYVFIGLLLLFRILRKWFDKCPSFIAVLTVYFTTNLFYYTVVCPGYSHAYSFFILTLFIYTLDKFFQKPNPVNSIYCGIALGIGFLIRPTNVFYALLFLLYEVNSFHSFKERIVWLLKKTKYILLIVLVIFVIFVPQMLYWFATVGKYVVFSYNYPEGGLAKSFIYWKNPKIGNVLFGVDSGWLIYSPVFLLFIGGLVWMLIKRAYYSIAIVVLFILILYANASWWCYTFSCSFGHRAFIEYYPLFIIPVAFILQKSFKAKKKIALYILALFLMIFSFVNLRFSLLYYREQCWTKPEWTWVKFNRALNKAFFVIPDKQLK